MSNKVSAQDLKNIQSILSTSKQTLRPPVAQPEVTQPTVVQPEVTQLESQKILEMLQQQSNGNLNQLNEVNTNNQNTQLATAPQVSATTKTSFNIMGMNISKNYVYIGLFVILVGIMAYMWYSGKKKEEKEKEQNNNDNNNNDNDNSNAKYNKLLQHQINNKLEDDQEHIFKMRELALRKKMMMEKDMAMRMQKKAMEEQINNDENIEVEG